MNGVKGVVLFPGAGSSSGHSSLVAIEESLAPIAVLRCDFPYRLAGKSFPDKTPVLVDSVRSSVRKFADFLGVQTSQLVIGGRSMGGRMCSMAVADQSDPLKVAGVVLISYPLHPPKKPENLRIQHLPEVTVPVLGISGTKDNFGSPTQLIKAFQSVPAPVEWQWIENGVHELKGNDIEVAKAVKNWVRNLSEQK